MGGFGSGRHGERPTVENGLTLDINRLIRQQCIVPGNHLAGTLTWGNNVASIGYEASLVSPDTAWVRLQYSVNGQPEDYLVRLTSTSCRYGGRRWWWKCPRSGRRAAKLYLPPGGTVFAARHVYGLAYRSQRLAALDRSHDRQRRLYRKLGASYDYFDQCTPPRPKGMHLSTYQRLTAELCDATELHDALFAIAAAPLMTRLMKGSSAQRG
jgi:hypothetical protein